MKIASSKSSNSEPKLGHNWEILHGGRCISKMYELNASLTLGALDYLGPGHGLAIPNGN